MRRIAFSLFAALAAASYVSAETQISVHQKEQVKTFVRATDDVDMLYGSTDFSIAGTSFAIADIDSITLVHTVTLDFDGDYVTITNPYTDVDIKADGAHVEINSANEKHEITYRLKGKSSSASIILNAAMKSVIEFAGVDLTSDGQTPPLWITSGKNTKVVIKDGTINTLTCGAQDTVGATFKSKGQLEFKRENGTLSIVNSHGHAIASSDYVEVHNGMLNLDASGDGIHVNDYYYQSGGSVSITAGADGVDVGEGYFQMTDGTLSVTSSGQGAKAVKCDALDKVAKSGYVTITGGTMRLFASGDGGRGIKADSAFVMSGGDVLVVVSGKTIIDEEATLDPLEPEYINVCGVKSSTTITVSGGQLSVIAQNTAGGSRCIQADKNITLSGGATTVHQNSSTVINKEPRGLQTDYGVIVSAANNLYIRVTDEAKAFKTEDGVYLDGSKIAKVNSYYDDEFGETPTGWKFAEFDK